MRDHRRNPVYRTGKRHLILAVALALLWRVPADAALQSGVTYYTLPGSMVEETGEAVQRFLPISARITFDLSATPPSFVAFIPNAPQEYFPPARLTVRGTGYRQGNGSYRFTGYYLPNYYLDWTFSNAPNGTLVWNGWVTWQGGRAWFIITRNLALEPQPSLQLAHAGNSIEMSWRDETNRGWLLEETNWLGTTNQPASWNPVAEVPRTENGRRIVRLAPPPDRRFYRLRGPW